MIQYGLRWWFRAVAGAVWGSTRFVEIRDAEALVFGTHHGGGRKGIVRLALTSNAAQSEPFAPGRRDYALRYLGYGLYPTDDNNRDLRRFLPVGSEFEFAFWVAPRYEGDQYRFDNPVELLRTLAELWITLGGLGARWRHGLGAMTINGQRATLQERIASICRLLQNSHKQMQEFLKQVNPEIPLTAERTLPLYSVSARPHLRIAMSDRTSHDYNGFLQRAHQLWRRSRLEDPANPRSRGLNTRVYRTFLEELHFNSASGSKPAASSFGQLALTGLGLPVPFGFPQGLRSIPGSGRNKVPHGSVQPVTGSNQKENEGRRASPIWIRPQEVAGGNGPSLALLIAKWDCVYLPGNQGEVRLKGDIPPGMSRPVSADPSEASRWFDAALRNKGNRLKIIY
jgi:CRISPR type III-B/RAMP module RAMP protein Cmr1